MIGAMYVFKIVEHQLIARCIRKLEFDDKGSNFKDRNKK